MITVQCTVLDTFPVNTKPSRRERFTSRFGMHFRHIWQIDEARPKKTGQLRSLAPGVHVAFYAHDHAVFVLHRGPTRHPWVAKKKVIGVLVALHGAPAIARQ